MLHINALIDRIGEEYALPGEVLTNLRKALDEVVTNIIKYAYPDGAVHDISIRCEVREGRLETTIEDDGSAFDPLDAPHFDRGLVSAAAYQRIGGRNRLTLKQEIGRG